MSEKINLIINGEEISVTEEKGDTALLSFLRDEMGLMGAKNGCGQGQCGTCTVIIDGEAKRSCLWKLKRINGSTVETIENLNKDGQLHPLQIAFLETGAVQCGFCTPGMIMSSKALLDKNNNPSEDEVRDALKRNICRCTGYQKIIESVQLAARYLREGVEIKENYTTDAFGKSVIRNDGLDKVQGASIYVDDYSKEDMLHGKLHLSEEPHAEIVDVDISEALQVTGVVEVLTADDIPGEKNFGLILDQQPILAYDRVRYVGEPIALILAESKEAAAKGSKVIKVEYKELPTYYKPQDALDEDAIEIHDDGNTLTHLQLRKGEYEEAFEEADVIVEDTYQTPFVEHAYLEPEGGLAEYNDGEITVWTPSQSSHKYQGMIAASLDLDEEEVRVINTCTGGAFGGREEPTVQIHAALGALVTERPVKIVLNRKESIRMSTKRHAAYLNYKMGATSDGKLVAAEAKIYTDTGAYASAGIPVANRATTFTFGPYVIPHAKVDTYSVYTNNLPGGAMRGFGSPQVCFAAERHLDKLAGELDIDPLEFRLKNALEEGKSTLTGHVLGAGIGFKDCLLELKESLAKEEYDLKDNQKIGIGIAGGYKNVGIGHGLPEDNQARIKLNKDGTFTLYVSCVDSGQGSDTAMAQVATEVLGCFYQDIEVIASDTDHISDGGVTTASRMSFLAGNAVKGCATKLKDKVLENASKVTGIPTERIELQGRDFINNVTGERIISLKEVANDYSGLKAKYDYHPPETEPIPEQNIPAYPTKDDDIGKIHFSYCYAVHAAIVAVDKETGEFEVLKIIAAHDVGKAINPKGVEGQIEGGVSMGVGYALSEEFYLKDGWPVQDTLSKLNLPNTANIPPIESIIIEEEHPEGPYGAKGMSELPVSPVAPAITNAIYDAIGLNINQIPIKDKLITK
ncbi:molybdopterin-dependent oxidoreductase [Selenihalanaerobacter shriftii]|uniref:CO or xanthine dehydrogenase, Mo-binding subunit n=1 Tax=Selenihalanaerobacter shriftii TaxID=142842 RepID=A0A1T4PL83_9FIRM|nr:molybdopterin cofactor-binding domain-containing protein [Selenihalanaerobacter shriftii]SJZ91648.1 CO or xanthine dehydrogenase, Mo-binding subunit [Selenihalanaerobacter shriftii]